MKKANTKWVANAYPTISSMQLQAVCTIWKWEPHQLRWGWPKEGLHKVPYSDTSLQTCSVGQWEGMLEVNW